MMNEFRTLLQTKLEEIQDLEVSPEVTDDLLEKGKTYFSYTLQKTFENSDTDGNFTYRFNLVGYVKRLQNDEENTLEIVDKKSDEIQKKLKDINIKSSFNDVSILDRVRKIQVTGECIYNELNKGIA